MRSSVVSRAKSLNYKPRSITSASTTITLTLTKQSADDNVVIIPVGSIFTASSGNQTLTFSNIQDYILQFNSSDVVGTTKTIDVEFMKASIEQKDLYKIKMQRTLLGLKCQILTVMIKH